MRERYPLINPIEDAIRRIGNPLHDEMLAIYKMGLENGKYDVLDKIRADIKQLPTAKCTETHRIYIDAADFKEDVLAIIDKYKAESEG